jgi:hypothetical protein
MVRSRRPATPARRRRSSAALSGNETVLRTPNAENAAVWAIASRSGPSRPLRWAPGTRKWNVRSTLIAGPGGRGWDPVLSFQGIVDGRVTLGPALPSSEYQPSDLFFCPDRPTIRRTAMQPRRCPLPPRREIVPPDRVTEAPPPPSAAPRTRGPGMTARPPNRSGSPAARAPAGGLAATDTRTRTASSHRTRPAATPTSKRGSGSWNSTVPFARTAACSSRPR